MTNLPDDMNWSRYDATIGSAETEAQEAFRGVQGRVMAECSRAWQAFPHDTSGDALDRWSLVEKALREADKALADHVSMGVTELKQMQDEVDRARSANDDCHVEGFRQCVEEYLGFYRREIESRENEA